MIVQCPSCASRYRIRDANIPPSGGKIRCPSCSHSFIVYPEVVEDDGDRTSVTSKGQISDLVDKMARQRAGQAGHTGLDPQEEDYVSTQVAAASDQARAMAALANELGDPMDMDGTVEIQNPMKVWQQAQNALNASRAAAGAAPPDDETDDYGDHTATEVVDPSKLNLPFPISAASPPPRPAALNSPAVLNPLRAQAPPSVPQVQTQEPPAAAPPNFSLPPTAEPLPPQDGPQADASSFGSGQYTPDTPAGGRHTQESWGPAAQQAPPQPAAANAFGRSPSGLTSQALFGDDAEDAAGALAAAQLGGGAAPAAGAGSADGEHGGPWKLKTNFGLTYEFPDTRGLRSWLSSREDLDGYTVSGDEGANFFALSAYPQLGQSTGRPAMPSGNMSIPSSHGSGLNPDPVGSGTFADPNQVVDPYQSGLVSDPANPTGGIKGPRVNAEYRPPSRESKYKVVLWLVFLLLFVVAVAIGLETFGIFKLSDYARELGILPQTVEKPVVPKADKNDKVAPKEEADPEEAAARRRAEVEKLIEDAERLIEGNKLPVALEKLETTEKVAPKNVRVHELKAMVFDKLGQSEKAAMERVKADELREEADGAEGTEPQDDEPNAGPDAGEPAAEDKPE